ncbi:MAG: sodium ABC transporter permease [Methanoculleus sp. SDB]|nr:MAG: sodium ABC transporter permease [Methanoculleus sp. SDB]
MNARHAGIIAKKELKGLYSEKTIILAILLQLFIAMFSTFLMVGLASMYDPDSVGRLSTIRYPIAYTGEDSLLVDYLTARDDLIVYEMDLDTAVTALGERKLSAVVWAPETAPDADDPIKITLYTIQNDIQSTVINVKLKEVFLAYESDLREIRAFRLDVQPFPLDFPPSEPGSNFYEFVYGLLIPLLVFMPAIISSALIIDLITEEYQHDTLETLMSTPVTFTEMIWGKVAACLAIVPVQSGAWLLLLTVNGIAIANAVPILLHVTAGSMAMILLGAVTALHYRDRTNAQFIFSTALVVVILFVLALPYNPLNLIVRLAVDAIGAEHWLFLAAVIAVTALGASVTNRYAARIGTRIFQKG